MRILFVIIAIIAIVAFLKGRYSLQTGGSGQPDPNPSSEPNTVTVLSSFTSDSLVKGWRIDVLTPGLVAFCTLQKNDSGVFTITGESLYQATKIGKQSMDLLPNRQLPVRAGDYYGIRAVGKNIIRSVPDEAARVHIFHGDKPLGVGSVLGNVTEQKGTGYSLSPITTRLYIAPNDGRLGSQKNPANSAQQILQFYTAGGHGKPLDGVYWIRPYNGGNDMAVEIYCNFSMRDGHGYMLVGAAAPGESWPSFDSGKYPFSPDFSHGEYDKYGRVGSYYLKWAQFDRGAISNADPERCKRGGHVYNKEGKYCGLKDGKRLKLKGSLTEIVLATGNGKYWVALDRDTLVSAKDGTIVPVATSENFETRPGVACSPNKVVYLKTGSKGKAGQGEPWINMGTAHACGDNYMFWGEDGFQANEQFKNKNGGIRIFVGGEYLPSDKSIYRHNPSLHRAPGRKTGKSTYREAISMCRSLGKKICTKKQLEQAQSDGFGGASCGWTSTGPDKHSLFTTQPLSIDLWAADETQDCTVQSKTKGRADIYCCDPYEFINFEYLDEGYTKANLWILKFEQAFHKRYNVDIPVGAKFIVYGDGKGVAVHKVDESAYALISGGGVAPTKWPSKTDAPACQIETAPALPRAKAKFLIALPEYDLRKDSMWSAMSAKALIKYGAVVRLTGHNGYLSAIAQPYTHISSAQLTQVIGHTAKDERSQWKVEPVDPGDNGTSVRSGDLIYLKNLRTKGRLAANITQPPVPGGHTGEILLSTYSQHNELTDCQWKVQVITSKFWRVGSSVRLQHVNTGKVVELTGGKHNSGHGTVNTAAGYTHYDHRSAFRTGLIRDAPTGTRVQKCVVYLNKIARARQLASQGGPDAQRATEEAKQLVDQFDRECYDVPQSAYNKAIWRLYGEIRKQLKSLTQETGLYQAYHAKEVATLTNLEQQRALMEKKKAELKKLKGRRCMPVKKCVNETGIDRSPASVNETCGDLLPLIRRGEVTDELIDKISELKRGTTHVNDYDIRTHQDAHKYVHNKDVDQCT